MIKGTKCSTGPHGGRRIRGKKGLGIEYNLYWTGNKRVESGGCGPSNKGSDPNTTMAEPVNINETRCPNNVKTQRLCFWLTKFDKNSFDFFFFPV
jgi:hypothetical protein